MPEDHPFIIWQITLSAVSYTHLDVYKRQMLLTILHGVGSIHQNTNVTTRTFNRGEEIVKRLVQYIIKHYTLSLIHIYSG